MGSHGLWLGQNKKQLVKAQGTKPGTCYWVRRGGSQLGFTAWVDHGKDGDAEGDLEDRNCGGGHRWRGGET